MGRFFSWVGNWSAAVRALGNRRRLHLSRPTGSPPIEPVTAMLAAIRAGCAAALAACRRALLAVPSLPRGVGRHLPSRAGRRPPFQQPLKTALTWCASQTRPARLYFFPNGADLISTPSRRSQERRTRVQGRPAPGHARAAAAPAAQAARRRRRPRRRRRVHAPGRARRDLADLHRQRHGRPHRRQRRRRRLQDDGEHVLAARGDHGVERDLRARHHRAAVGRLRARDPAGQRRPSGDGRHGHHRVGAHQEGDAERQRHHRRRLPPRGGDARAARPRPHLRDPSERRLGHHRGRRGRRQHHDARGLQRRRRRRHPELVEGHAPHPVRHLPSQLRAVRRRRDQPRRPDAVRLGDRAARPAAGRARRHPRLQVHAELRGRRRRGDQQLGGGDDHDPPHRDHRQPGPDDRRPDVRPGSDEPARADPAGARTGRLRAELERDRERRPTSTPSERSRSPTRSSPATRPTRTARASRTPAREPSSSRTPTSSTTSRTPTAAVSSPRAARSPSRAARSRTTSLPHRAAASRPRASPTRSDCAARSRSRARRSRTTTPAPTAAVSPPTATARSPSPTSPP